MNEHADEGLEAAIQRLERGPYSTSANYSTLIAMAAHRLTPDQIRRLMNNPAERSMLEQALGKNRYVVRTAAIAKDPCACEGGESCRCLDDNE